MVAILRNPKGRHPGMDCRGLGYMDVNPAVTGMVSHILVPWIPAIHAGMTSYLKECHFG